MPRCGGSWRSSIVAGRWRSCDRSWPPAWPIRCCPQRRTAGDPARLRRVHAQPISPDGDVAEVAAHYTRGGRVHAIACRVEQVNTATGPRWQVVALHLT